MKALKRSLYLLCLLSLVAGCAAQIKQVGATDADGQTYTFCVKVVQPLNPLALREIVLACATTQAAALEQQARLQELYPNLPMRIVARRAQ